VSGPEGAIHLTTRLLDVITARPLTGAERARVEGWLRADEATLFWAQPVPDQRHGLEAAAVVESKAPARLDLIRAALLHDVGKRHARLGWIGRSLATLWSMLGGHPRGRWSLYLEHGGIAASELERIGCEPLVVAYARHHHGVRPQDLTVADWDVLKEADS
jgi:hypothetical protein